MQQRKDEILKKKEKLAELKRQRELRSKEFSSTRQSIGTPSEVSPPRDRTQNKAELDSLISSLVGEERGSPAPRTPPSNRARSARPSSYVPSPAGLVSETPDETGQTPPVEATRASGAPQKLSFAPMRTTYEITADPPKREVITYSKGVQTSLPASPIRSPGHSDSEERSSSGAERKPQRRRSRRQREREEELRQNLRKEIEDELKTLAEPKNEGSVVNYSRAHNFPARALDSEELNAVTSSNDFLHFVERSSKVIERALDEEYDVLADYRHGAPGMEDDEEEEYGSKGRKGRRLKQVIQFYDERWSRKRMISDIGFSHKPFFKFPELVLSSYTKNPSAPYDPDGLVQVWNLHMHDRPEYIFQATSDILTAKFSPFHPNLILGGSYSGQVLLWDTRSRSPHPVQRTPLTGSGHTHPVYSLNVVGTQNAHNIISTSTDGVLCSWSVDMLSAPQEYLELTAPPLLPTNTTNCITPPITPSRPTDDLAPTTTAFPPSDPTYLLLGTESGSIHLAHRYDRAGARSGTDARVLYTGHAAPIMSMDFHRPTGPLDLGDLVLSSSLDWTVKLWRIRTPAAALSGTASGGTGGARLDLIGPALDLPARDDAVYDAKWSPVKPGVFACVDGSGALEVWDLCVDVEVPIARAVPERDGLRNRSLNKCAWEPHDGRRIAAGGLDGVLSVWEVGSELGGADSAKADEWSRMKRLVQRSEGKGTER